MTVPRVHRQLADRPGEAGRLTAAGAAAGLSPCPQHASASAPCAAATQTLLLAPVPGYVAGVAVAGPSTTARPSVRGGTGVSRSDAKDRSALVAPGSVLVCGIRPFWFDSSVLV